MKIPSKKKILIAVVVIFFASILVRNWPIQHKEFPPRFAVSNLILARNFAETGKFSFKNAQDVLLSSTLIKEEGVPTHEVHKLTPILYGYLYRILGINDYSNLNVNIWVSLISYAITTVLLFLLVLKLTNFYLALIFALLDILSPIVNDRLAISGSYEFAMLFFCLALLIYLYQKKPKIWRLILASIFFALAGLARNGFIIAFIPFLIHEGWQQRSIKRLIIFLLPFVIIAGSFFVYDRLSGQTIVMMDIGDLGYDAHLYPDPYIYHFEKDEFIKSFARDANPEEVGSMIRFGIPVGFKAKLLSYAYSLKFYVFNLFNLITYGGPVLILFSLVGVAYLYLQKNSLFKLFMVWFIILFGALIYLLTSNPNHFVEFRFPIIFLSSLGVYLLIKLLFKSSLSLKSKYLLSALIILSLAFHLGQANKWLFHERYSNSNMASNMALVNTVQEFNQNNKITDKDVIAVGYSNESASFLNYYTNLNCVYVSPKSIEKLIAEKKIKEIYDWFGVNKIVGYKMELSEKIVKETGVENIGNK